MLSVQMKHPTPVYVIEPGLDGRLSRLDTRNANIYVSAY